MSLFWSKPPGGFPVFSPRPTRPLHASDLIICCFSLAHFALATQGLLTLSMSQAPSRHTSQRPTWFPSSLPSCLQTPPFPERPFHPPYIKIAAPSPQPALLSLPPLLYFSLMVLMTTWHSFCPLGCCSFGLRWNLCTTRAGTIQFTFPYLMRIC